MEQWWRGRSANRFGPGEPLRGAAPAPRRGPCPVPSDSERTAMDEVWAKALRANPACSTGRSPCAPASRGSPTAPSPCSGRAHLQELRLADGAGGHVVAALEFAEETGAPDHPEALSTWTAVRCENASRSNPAHTVRPKCATAWRRSHNATSRRGPAESVATSSAQQRCCAVEWRRSGWAGLGSACGCGRGACQTASGSSGSSCTVAEVPGLTNALGAVADVRRFR